MQICSQRGKRCSVTISTHGNSTAAPSLAARGHCSLASLVVHSSISMMPSFVSITRRLVAMRSMSVTRRQFGYCLGEPTPLSTRGTFIRTYITIMHSLWPVRRPQRLQPVGDIVHTSESVDQVGSSTLPLITLLHCQPSRELGDCWRRIGGGEPFHFGNATRFSPLAWLQLRSSIRAASGRVTIGSIPSTGALAVHAAMRLCAGKPISIFGFGNGSSLNCAMTGTPNGTLCDRYYALGNGAGLRRCVNEADHSMPSGGL